MNWAKNAHEYENDSEYEILWNFYVDILEAFFVSTVW